MTIPTNTYVRESADTPLLLGLGEVLWDILPEGRKLGGAPANFAFHADNLGARGCPVSRIGDDDLGREALHILASHGLDTSLISTDSDRPTGTVTAELDAEGRATYVFPPNTAWDNLQVDDRTLKASEQAKGVCFGTLAQRSEASREAIHAILDHVPAECVKMLDVNLRGDFYSKDVLEASLKRANALKLSDEELPVAAKHFNLPEKEQAALETLVRRFNLRMAVLTRGAQGSLIVTPEGSHDHPGLPVSVQDTIGAGDAFTAASVLGLLKGWAPDAINERAARVAAAVCEQSGAMVPVPQDLRIF